MRKVSICLSVALLLFTLTACGKTQAEEIQDADGTPTQVATQQPEEPSDSKGAGQPDEPDNGAAENVTGIFDMLNELEYQPYTCDGLPEYLLSATDGTVYSINFSEKWVWRGSNEQAELSDELIAQLKEDANLIQTEYADTETESKQSGSTPMKDNMGEPHYEDSEPEIEVCYEDPNNPVAGQNHHVGEPRYEDSEPEIEVCYDDPNNPVAEQNYSVGEPRYSSWVYQ